MLPYRFLALTTYIITLYFNFMSGGITEYLIGLLRDHISKYKQPRAALGIQGALLK